VLHGAAMSAAAGLDVDQFFSLLPSFLHETQSRSGSFQAMIRAQDYTDVKSSLQTDLAAARLLADTASQIGMPSLFSKGLIDLMQDAVERGQGTLDSAAMLECFLHKV
jgi:3-hydroxyisobutyrate dehydrogenase-like beta-hydroxyacid dehydrogenase